MSFAPSSTQQTDGRQNEAISGFTHNRDISEFDSIPRLDCLRIEKQAPVTVIASGADVDAVPGSTLALNLDVLEVESVEVSKEFVQYVDNELEFSGQMNVK